MPELVTRALADGGTESHVPDLDAMLRAYYAHRDWDWASGKPARAKLRALGMDAIANELWK
jgi:aldehyde:ferredoxin oxidoreductase